MGGGGGGAPLVTQYWGGTRHFFLLILYILKILGGGGGTCPPDPYSVIPGSIKRIKHFVLPATPHRVYEGVVQAHFDYCCIVWGNLLSTNYKDFKIGQRGF